MKNVLITGSNGLIGEALVANLKAAGNFNVHCVSHTPKDGSAIELDFNKNWDDAILPSKMDVVVHLAQSEKFRNFPESANEVFNVNTQSTIRLLEYARKARVSKFIYASSGGVYGNSDKGFNEDSPLVLNKDLGFYLTTKFCSELIVENYKSVFDINILRFFFAFGEKQRKDMLIPRLVESIKNGKAITLQGEEGIKINPIYVHDAANAITAIVNKPGSYNINIGGTEILSIKQIGTIIGELLAKKPVFEYQNSEVKNLIGDITNMKKLYEPKMSFKEAVKKLI